MRAIESKLPASFSCKPDWPDRVYLTSEETGLQLAARINHSTFAVAWKLPTIQAAVPSVTVAELEAALEMQKE